MWSSGDGVKEEDEVAACNLHRAGNEARRLYLEEERKVKPCSCHCSPEYKGSPIAKQQDQY